MERTEKAEETVKQVFYCEWLRWLIAVSSPFQFIKHN